MRLVAIPTVLMLVAVAMSGCVSDNSTVDGAMDVGPIEPPEKPAINETVNVTLPPPPGPADAHRIPVDLSTGSIVMGATIPINESQWENQGSDWWDLYVDVELELGNESKIDAWVVYLLAEDGKRLQLEDSIVELPLEGESYLAGTDNGEVSRGIRLDWERLNVWRTQDNPVDEIHIVLMATGASGDGVHLLISPDPAGIQEGQETTQELEPVFQSKRPWTYQVYIDDTGLGAFRDILTAGEYEVTEVMPESPGVVRARETTIKFPAGAGGFSLLSANYRGAGAQGEWSMDTKYQDAAWHKDGFIMYHGATLYGPIAECLAIGCSGVFMVQDRTTPHSTVYKVRAANAGDWEELGMMRVETGASVEQMFGIPFDHYASDGSGLVTGLL